MSTRKSISDEELELKARVLVEKARARARRGAEIGATRKEVEYLRAAAIDLCDAVAACMDENSGWFSRSWGHDGRCPALRRKPGDCVCGADDLFTAWVDLERALRFPELPDLGRVR
jgi:hypothetical protein